MVTYKRGDGGEEVVNMNIIVYARGANGMTVWKEVSEEVNMNL